MKRERKHTFDPKAFLAKADGDLISEGSDHFLSERASGCRFYIQEGKVKINVVSEQGKEAIVAILGVGDFCGEGCLAGQPLRIAIAIGFKD
jgi:CRP/FNR family transcriptional regulator, cyclic AMP receptor protein